jgi:predicted RNA-binding Zn-ribbon protein involved in translation (DUF1610 family)
MSQNEVPCPSCGASLEIDDTVPPGKIMRCPECGAGLILSGEKGRRLDVREPPRSEKSAKKKSRPRLAHGGCNAAGADQGMIRLRELYLVGQAFQPAEKRQTGMSAPRFEIVSKEGL